MSWKKKEKRKAAPQNRSEDTSFMNKVWLDAELAYRERSERIRAREQAARNRSFDGMDLLLRGGSR